MKQGWKIVKLPELAKSIFAGGDVDKNNLSKVKTEEYPYPIYTNGETNKGLYGYTNIFRVDEPAITVSARGTIGFTCLRKEPYYPAVRLINIIPKENVDINYLNYFIKSKTVTSSGASIPQLTVPMVKEFEIGIPESQEEQRTIVAKLDQAFAAIDQAKANIEKNIANAKELFQSKLNQIFSQKGEGWEERKLNELFIIRPPKKEAKEALNDEDEVTFLPMEDLEVLTKNVVPVKKKKLKEVAGSYTYFAENDVLLAKITPCFENGKLGIAKGLINRIGFGSSEYIVFRTKGKILSEYLFYFLSRDTFRNEGKRKMQGAVGHKRVSKEFIEEYLLSYPSIETQQQIVDQLDQLQEQTNLLVTKYQQKLANLEELKKSILEKAFKGELV